MNVKFLVSALFILVTIGPILGYIWYQYRITMKQKRRNDQRLADFNNQIQEELRKARMGQ